MEITAEERRLINSTYSEYPRRRNMSFTIPDLPCTGYIVEAYSCNSEGVDKDWRILEVDLETYTPDRLVNRKDHLDHDLRYVPAYLLLPSSTRNV